MTSALSRYATPFITGLFLVSLVSGVALFFHVGMGTFHEMHEILSMVLIVPFVLHVWKNWRSVVNYLKRAPMWIGLAVSLLVAVPFALPSSGSEGRSGPPQFAIAMTVLQSSVQDVAPIFGTDGAGLTAKLTAAGFTVTDPSESLIAVAEGSGQSVEAVAAALVAR
ncbi:hypothetical protein C8J27_11242 [Rhodobacter aestuarii]|uniref:DUF4405 domain-containing protein n=1 Tax=Rhodobacter aestuarii TaxID=453582 RepID=A0A1N7Q918_9RHOB|nr:DUF4405 domain-containing protein [Rhodobacter aestuarii]PTV93762.1 hypothetical protein C8J27_11242 [Rhodobacter aestuarii]SIT19350.1 hypothetical protein SAMN05421580_11442 [Rhodobacter aestuarii]